MMMVAVCTDATPPAEASAFSSCTAVAWTDAVNVSPGLFDGLTMDSIVPVAVAMMSAFALAWVIRRLADAARV
jgi:hypothetical protein